MILPSYKWVSFSAISQHTLGISQMSFQAFFQIDPLLFLFAVHPLALEGVHIPPIFHKKQIAPFLMKLPLLFATEMLPLLHFNKDKQKPYLVCPNSGPLSPPPFCKTIELSQKLFFWVLNFISPPHSPSHHYI